MTDKVETREIIVGVSDQAIICGDISWFWRKWGDTQVRYPTNVVSLDNKEVTATLYNVVKINQGLNAKMTSPHITHK